MFSVYINYKCDSSSYIGTIYVPLNFNCNAVQMWYGNIWKLRRCREKNLECRKETLLVKAKLQSTIIILLH